MLRLLLGAAGCGKTRRVCEEIKARMEHTGGMVLLTPEQQSHRAERRLAAVCGPRLSLCGEVLSFTRMYNRAAVELGGLADPLPDKGGRLLLMALALEDVGPGLRRFGERSRRADFLRRLMSTAEELQSAMTTPGDLRAAAEKASGVMREKLEDMAMVMEAWEAVQIRRLGDCRDAAARLADGIADCSVGAGGVWADGFTDFTARELAVLEGILRRGTDLTVALTLGEGEEERFAVPEGAFRSLAEMARRLGTELKVERLPSPEPDPIRYLAENLDRYDAPPFPMKDGSVEVCRMDSFPGECRWAAARIRELMMADGSLRYSDIAVAVPGFGERRSVLAAVFRAYALPVYVEEAEPFAPSSLAVYVLEALRTVTEGWRSGNLLRCLRTGFGPLSAEETDELENYCLTWNLRGEGTWRQEEPWDLSPEGYGDASPSDGETLKRLNSLRSRVAAPFGRLADALRSEGSAGEALRALSAFLAETGAAEQSRLRAEALEAGGDAAGGAACVRLWSALRECLEEMDALLGDVRLSGEEFTRLLELLIREKQVGSIPAALDCVSLGSPERLRFRRPRVLLVLGADDEHLPGQVPASGLFSPEEKRLLTALGIRLDREEDAELTRPLLETYLLAASPKEKLLVSYSGGEGIRPSILAERAVTLLSAKLETEESLEGRHLAAAPLPALSLALGKGPWADAARACLPPEKLADVRAAAAQVHVPLQSETVRKLYGSTLRLTPSRAERYYQCSYRYFLEYGLRLKERKVAEFAAPQRGSFFHYLLENVCREVRSGGGFAAVTGETLRALTRKYAEAYVAESFKPAQLRDKRFAYLFRRLCDTAENIVLEMAEQLAAGDFLPLDFELEISDRGGELPPLDLGGILVEGKVDRVDGWADGDQLYLCVADYKSGPKEFRLSDVCEGQTIQMLIYLFLLTSEGQERYGKRIVPGGVLYLPARDKTVSLPRSSTEEEIRKARAAELKISGLMLDDPDMLRARDRSQPPRYLPVSFKDGVPVKGVADLRRMGELDSFVRGLLRRMGEELRNGKAEASPLAHYGSEDPCRYCEYGRVCGFDPKRQEKRLIRRMTDGEFWELAEKEAAHG